MRLKSITLCNFQTHKDLTVEFAPGISTIVGPTDKGKSAVLRALQWAALNNLGGVEFIREGSKETEVRLTIRDVGGNELEIVRTKGQRNVNSYQLDDQEFVAFGQSSVPADIAGLLKLNEINFQGQHDAPFWFSETPGEVSRQLNSVIDLSVIDTTLFNIGAEVRKAVEREELCKERLKEAKEQLEELLPQKGRVEDFQALKEKDARFRTAVAEFEEVLYLAKEIDTNQTLLDTTSEKAVEGIRVTEAMLEARRAGKQERELHVILTNILEWEKKVVSVPDFGPVSKAHADWEEIQEDCDTLQDLVERTVTRHHNALALKVRADETEKKFHEQIKGRRCPLCHNLIR